MKKRLFLLLCLAGWPGFGWAQMPTREQLTGTWIGMHYAWDSDFLVPIGSYLQFNTDGSYVIGALNEQEPPVRSQWSLQNGVMRMDTNQLRAGQVRVHNALLYIDGYFSLTFRRFQDTPVSIDLVRETISNHVWISGTKRYHFHQNGQACVEQLTSDLSASGDRTVHDWSLTAHQRSVFLLIKGVQGDNVGNYQPSLQITSVQPDSFRAISWDGEGVSEQTFRSVATLSPDSVCHPVGFQPCITYLYRPRNMYYSYDQKGHNNQLYFIRKVFSESYKAAMIPGQSGLIRIRFQVNCRGEAGRFEVLELDNQYQERPFDPRITQQLLTICRQSLGLGWLPAKRNDEASLSDYVQFITFRLKDGVITEIFP